ncbi:MAG: HlyD family efflux transporter periplasmic adaptor subunit [Deltaproteobacteria bacterium]|nr:HlyD family efflux transporter periplasmic adaptor subunit [Deltaproteobacteria bacterium]
MKDALSPQDVVPALRADLELGDPVPGRGEGDIRLSHPQTGKALVLKGVEVSVARMLDGRRTADDVINAAAKIGIPMKLQGLNGFIHKLEREGLLVEAPAPRPDGISTWEPRAEWSVEVRTLFQAALRAARAEDFASARSRLEQLLAISPDTAEAKGLLQWVMQRLFPDVHADGPQQKFSDFFAEVERSWFAEGERRSEANANASVEPTDVDLSDVDGFTVHTSGGPGKGLLVGVGAMVLLGVMLFPLPHTATTTFQLAPRSVTPVTIAHPGTLATLSVGVGQWVAKGAVLASWDTAAAKQTAATLEAKLTAASKGGKPSAAQLKQLPKAKAKLAKAKLMAKVATSKADKLKAKLKGKSNAALVKLQKSQAAAEAAVASAQKEVDSLSGQGASAPADVASMTAALALAKTQSTEPPLTAPADGTVLDLTAKAGQALAAGATFAKLEDSHTLKVTIDVPKGEELAVGSTVQLDLPSPVKVTIDKVDGATAEAELPNPNGALKSGTKGSASFSGSSKSLLGRL